MLSGVAEISPKTYLSLIDHTLVTGGNMLVIALAGSGKTEMVQARLEEKHIPYRYLNLSVLEAPDLLGVPRVDDVTGTMEYATPYFLPYIDRTPEPVALVIDELDKAKSELQNPMLELMQFHSVNGKKLNIKAIFCTGNMPDEGAFSLPINHALTNRCGVYKMETQFPDWQDWATRNNVNPLIVGFLSKNPDKLQMQPNKDDTTAYCRPSPRSWVRAASDIDQLSEGVGIEMQTIVVSGRVGVAAASEFRVWIEHYRILAPYIDRLVLDGTFPPSKDMTVDKLLVASISACGEVRKAIDAKGTGKKKDDLVLRTATHVFDWIATLSPENQIAAVKNTLQPELILKSGIINIESVQSVYDQLKRVLLSK